LEKLNDSDDINRAWENIQENFKKSGTKCLGLYELKQQKPGLIKMFIFFR